MSGFGMFEANVTSDAEEKRQVREAANKLAAATYDVREKFGHFLFASKDLAEYNDRLALSKTDILKTIEPHVFPRTGTVRRVLKPLEQEFKSRQARTASRRTAEEYDPFDAAGLERPKANSANTPSLLQDLAGFPVSSPVSPASQSPAGLSQRQKEVLLPTGPSTDTGFDPKGYAPPADAPAPGTGGFSGLTPGSTGKSPSNTGSGTGSSAGNDGTGGSDWTANSGGGDIPAGDYTIKPGDTLSDIASRSGYGDDYASLGDANGISNYDQINAGDTINIGGGSSSSAGESSTSAGDSSVSSAGAPSEAASAPLAAEAGGSSAPDTSLVGTNPGNDMTNPGLTSPGLTPTARRAASLRRRAEFEGEVDVDATFSPSDDELEPEGNFGKWLDSVDQGAESKIDRNFSKDSTRRFAQWCYANRRLANLDSLERYAPSDREYIAIAATMQRVAKPTGPEWNSKGKPKLNKPTKPAPMDMHETPQPESVSKPQPTMEFGPTKAAGKHDPDPDEPWRNTMDDDPYRDLMDTPDFADLPLDGKYKGKHRAEARRRTAAPDYLQKADEALTNLLNQKAEEFQGQIAPLQQALQTVQQAEQEAQAANPLNVMPPAGTVNVMPEAPGGDAGAGGGLDPAALAMMMGGGGGDPSMGGGDPSMGGDPMGGGGAPPGMDPAMMGGAPPAAQDQGLPPMMARRRRATEWKKVNNDGYPAGADGGNMTRAERDKYNADEDEKHGLNHDAARRRQAKNVDQLWDEFSHSSTMRGGTPDIEAFAARYKVGPKALKRIQEKAGRKSGGRGKGRRAPAHQSGRHSAPPTRWVGMGEEEYNSYVNQDPKYSGGKHETYSVPQTEDQYGDKPVEVRLPHGRNASRKKAWSGWGGASASMKRVAGWEFDHRLNGYITTAADKFSCDCGSEFNTPSGYRKCGSCGRAWNSYVIGTDNGHGKEAALEKVICREIPVRKDVIVASKRRREATGLGYSDSDNGRNPGVGNPGYGDYMTQKSKEMDEMYPGGWQDQVQKNFQSQVNGNPNLEYMHTDYSPLYARPDVVVSKGLADKSPPIPGYYLEDDTWEDFSKRNPAAASKAQFDRRMILPMDAIREWRSNPDNGDGYPQSKAYPANPENKWKMPDYDAEAAERKQQYQDWERSKGRKSNRRRQARDMYSPEPELAGKHMKPEDAPSYNEYQWDLRRKRPKKQESVPGAKHEGLSPFEHFMTADKHTLRRIDLRDMEPEEPKEQVEIEHFSSRRREAGDHDLRMKWSEDGNIAVNPYSGKPEEMSRRKKNPQDRSDYADTEPYWPDRPGKHRAEAWKRDAALNYVASCRRANRRPTTQGLRRFMAEHFDVTEEGGTEKGKGTPGKKTTMSKPDAQWHRRNRGGQYT